VLERQTCNQQVQIPAVRRQVSTWMCESVNLWITGTGTGTRNVIISTGAGTRAMST